MTATTAAARKALELIAADPKKADAVIIAEAELGTDSLAVVEYAQTHTYNYSTGEERTYTTRMTVRDNGNVSTGLKGDSKAATRKLTAVLAEDAEDAVLRPQLTGLVRNATLADELAVIESAPAVGDVAYVFAMGYLRRGIVTKVTKTKATVAYTTASSAGRIFRKAAPFAELRFDAAPAAAPAPAELTEAEHRAAGGWDAVEEGTAFDADLNAQQAADDEERARQLEEELAEEPVPAQPGDLITVKLVAAATARHGGTSVTGYLVDDTVDGIVLREYPRAIPLAEVDRVSIVLRAGDQLRA